MQDDNTHDRGLKDFQPVDNEEAASAVYRPIHSLALQQENYG